LNYWVSLLDLLILLVDSSIGILQLFKLILLFSLLVLFCDHLIDLLCVPAWNITQLTRLSLYNFPLMFTLSDLGFIDLRLNFLLFFWSSWNMNNNISWFTKLNFILIIVFDSLEAFLGVSLKNHFFIFHLFVLLNRFIQRFIIEILMFWVLIKRWRFSISIESGLIRVRWLSLVLGILLVELLLLLRNLFETRLYFNNWRSVGNKCTSIFLNVVFLQEFRCILPIIILHLLTNPMKKIRTNKNIHFGVINFGEKLNSAIYLIIVYIHVTIVFNLIRENLFIRNILIQSAKYVFVVRIGFESLIGLACLVLNLFQLYIKFMFALYRTIYL